MRKLLAHSDTPAPGEIVVVPYPYSDQLAEKRRPALVISSAAFNQRHKLVWLAMITSAANAGWEGDVDLPAGDTGLAAHSLIRTAKIATVDLSRIVRIAGKVPSITLQHVRTQIGQALEII